LIQNALLTCTQAANQPQSRVNPQFAYNHAKMVDAPKRSTPIAAATPITTPRAATLTTPSAPHPWVPIRRLTSRHRRRALAHLQSLDAQDRYLRFGSPATDEQIARYVDGLDFQRDEVFGIFNRKLELLAMAHLAFLVDPPAVTATESSSAESQSAESATPPTGEFGVSVLKHARGRGYGGQLFAWSVLHARNHGLERLIIHALSENQAMLAIARKAGATVVRDGSESQATLQLPPDDLMSHVWQMVGDAVGLIDFRIKHRARTLDSLLTSFSSVGTLIMPRDQATPAPSKAGPPSGSAAGAQTSARDRAPS
jgi:RimJ/RimL family protein N-acetyltransferase